MYKPRTLSLGVASLLLLTLSPATLGAQESAQKDQPSAKMTATGCLQKGDEAGGYTLTDSDGKVWELRSKSVKLAPHVGHTVTVTGSPAEASKTHEAKIETDEKKETEGKQHGDLHITHLKMVSESCK